MHTQTPPQTAQPPLGRQLARVFLPGRIEPRVEAAASLPLWVAGPMAILSIYLLVETIANNIVAVDSLDRGFDVWSVLRLRVLHEVFSDGEAFLIALFVLALLLLGLEAVNLLVLAPFSVPMGEKLRSHLGPCRKVIYSLGGLWVLQAAVLWTLVCLFVVPWLYWCVIRPNMEGFLVDEIFTAFVFYIAFPLALLLGLMMRLMGTCNHLAGTIGEPPAQLCAGCGYLLEGLAAGAGCPECGLADPAQADRTREATPWSASRGIRRLGSLVQTCVAVGLQPNRFFRHMQVWGQAREGRRFLCWTIWLSMPLSVLSLPGVMAAWGSRPMSKEDWYMVPAVMVVLSLMLALVVMAVLGLLTVLIGLGSSRARQEPVWPIAAAAGSYLAGLVPWIAAAQALWLWPFFAVDGPDDIIWTACEAQGMSPTPEVLFVTLLLLPTIVGLLLAIRTAVVCYRAVRYACR
jgi:hypothetical protein